MALLTYPGPWRIMMCDFDTGFQPPEIVKRRPVVTISRKRNDDAPLCTVIPISSTRPDVIRDFHYLLPADQLPPHLQGKFQENWVKIDLIQTVGFFRLDLPWAGRNYMGRRIYFTTPVSQEHRAEIYRRIIERLAWAQVDL